jgi:hypothetical protein
MGKGVPAAKAICVNKQMLIIKTGSTIASLNIDPFFILISPQSVMSVV